MAAEILVPLIFFASLFGIVYLFLSTRHRERMALIEKGADASLFHTGNPRGRKSIILNLSLTLIGIGLGSMIAIFLYAATGLEEVYPACIFTMAGIGLLISFFLGNKHADKTIDNAVL
jgi:hypothetical protein